MASSWVVLPPLQPRVMAASAAVGPSSRVLLAYAPLSRSARRRVERLAPPRCSAVEDPGPSAGGGGGEGNGVVVEEEEEREEVRKKEPLRRRRGRRRPVWSRILFASKKTRSIIVLNALTVIYASDIPVLKEVEALTEPAVFNMVRFVVSAIPFIPFAIRAFGDRRVRNSGLELGLWVSLAYISQALGLISSEAGRASFITAFTVIVVPLIDGIFGASIPKLTWFGAIVSLVGIGLLECGGSPPCVGDVLNFFAAVFFGIHMLRTEQISRSTDKKKFLALLSFEVLVVAFSSVLWFLFKDSYVDVHDSSFESWTFGMLWDTATSFPWIPALYTGVFSTVLCMWAEMVAMGDVSATETAIVYGLEPVWGAAFAWFLLGERWDNAAWFGAALVLCGSLTVQLFGSSPEKSKKVKTRSRNNLETPLKRQDYLSLSAIPVDSRKNIGSRLDRFLEAETKSKRFGSAFGNYNF
uniref:EamA domain-containing protein n=1 Tax=Leersia perrieri TaxID=77586 RepID=A0A0D9VY02_9ORYZ